MSKSEDGTSASLEVPVGYGCLLQRDFPSDEALTKLFYLALRNISQKWSMPIRDWKAALTRFTIEFADRISIN